MTYREQGCQVLGKIQKQHGLPQDDRPTHQLTLASDKEAGDISDTCDLDMRAHRTFWRLLHLNSKSQVASGWCKGLSELEKTFSQRRGQEERWWLSRCASDGVGVSSWNWLISDAWRDHLSVVRKVEFSRRGKCRCF